MPKSSDRAKGDASGTTVGKPVARKKKKPKPGKPGPLVPKVVDGKRVMPRRMNDVYGQIYAHPLKDDERMKSIIRGFDTTRANNKWAREWWRYLYAGEPIPADTKMFGLPVCIPVLVTDDLEVPPPTYQLLPQHKSKWEFSLHDDIKKHPLYTLGHPQVVAIKGPSYRSKPVEPGPISDWWDYLYQGGKLPLPLADCGGLPETLRGDEDFSALVNE